MPLEQKRFYLNSKTIQYTVSERCFFEIEGKGDCYNSIANKPLNLIICTFEKIAYEYQFIANENIYIRRVRNCGFFEKSYEMFLIISL